MIMSAEKTPEWLVDLLYAGEEEDEAGASPPEFDLSDEERASVERTRALLAEARGQLSLAAPGDAVRSAILEQARAAAAAGVAQVAAAEPSASAPGRRGPSTREPGKTLWSRSRTSSVAQIVAVALALVASAALLSSLQNKQHAPTAAFDPVAEIAQRSPAPADQLAAAPTTADAPVGKLALNQEAPAAPAAPAPDPELLSPPAEELEKAPRAASDEARGRRDMPPMPSAPMKKTDSLNKGDAAGLSSADDDLFGGNPAAEDTKRYKEAEAAPRTVIAKADAPELDEQAVRPMREVAADKDAGRQFNSPESKAPVAAKPAEPMADAKPTPTRPASRPADSAAGPAPKPAAEEARAEGASEQQAAAKQPAKPQTATVASVRADFKRADYRGTVANADQFLGSGQGTADQRAEIMDLKAQALDELGQTAQADQLMRDIERQYPDYYRKNNLSRRKEAPSKAKKRMYNFVDSADTTSESY
jgi:hypothetical protein